MISQYDSISDLGARLRAYRIEKHLTPKEVAEKTGVSRAAIYRYESGQPVRVDVLGRIADLFEVSLSSLLGGGVEYFSSALNFFERMRQVESTAEQLSGLFAPISYLLTTESYDNILAEVLAESIPFAVHEREKALSDLDNIVEILKERKRNFKKRRPNIISLVSAGELDQFCRTGFIGCSAPEGVDMEARREVAAIEIVHLVELLEEQPIGIQVGILVDSLPGTIFQVFKQSNHSQVAISPFRLGAMPNVRIGVATISASPEFVELHNQLLEKLWQRSMKGGEAANFLKKTILKK